jgi:hypothetical protein
MLWLTARNWCHRTADVLNEVSLKPMSLQPGSSVLGGEIGLSQDIYLHQIQI